MQSSPFLPSCSFRCHFHSPKLDSSDAINNPPCSSIHPFHPDFAVLVSYSPCSAFSLSWPCVPGRHSACHSMFGTCGSVLPLSLKRNKVKRQGLLKKDGTERQAFSQRLSYIVPLDDAKFSIRFQDVKYICDSNTSNCLSSHILNACAVSTCQTQLRRKPTPAPPLCFPPASDPLPCFIHADAPRRYFEPFRVSLSTPNVCVPGYSAHAGGTSPQVLWDLCRVDKEFLHAAFFATHC